MPDENGKLKIAGRYRYTESYRMSTKVTSDGSTVEVAEYIGIYLHAEHPEELYQSAKLLARVVSFAILCSLILLLSMNGFSVYQGGMYVFAPVTISIIPAVYLVLGAWKLPQDDRHLQEDVYRFAHLRIRRSAIGVCIFLSAGILLAIVFFLVSDTAFRTADILFCLLLLIPLISDILLLKRMQGLRYRSLV